MYIKKLLCDILGMCPAAWELLGRTAALSLCLALCALALTLDNAAGGSISLLLISQSLAEAPAGLFAVAGVGACLLEREHRLR